MGDDGIVSHMAGLAESVERGLLERDNVFGGHPLRTAD